MKHYVIHQKKWHCLKIRKIILKFDHGIGNLLLSQSDSPLVDILSSLLKGKEKVPILRTNINIINTRTANNISTQGTDTLDSLSQLVHESENKASPPVTSISIKDYFVLIMYLTYAKKCLMISKLKFWKKNYLAEGYK